MSGILRIIFGALVFPMLMTAPALAGTADSQENDRQLGALGARYFDFVSQVTGRAYRVFLSVPDIDPPKGGFPVIYVLDADALFGITAGIVRERSMLPDPRPAVVVGIGYPAKHPVPWPDRRNKDLTLPIDPETLKAYYEGTHIVPSVGQYGDVDRFLKVIESEIKPLVAKRVLLNVRDQALLGHSLGGLAVLRALFTEPAAFQTFIASSPSIWWADKAILKGESDFSASVIANRVQPRVLLEVGGLETEPPYAFMVDDAAALGSRLAQISGGSEYAAKTVIFPDEDHLSVVPAAISRGLTFAFGSRSNR